MTALVINSADSLQRAMGVLREEYGRHHFLRINLKTGKDRSVDQNALTHAWYGQIARELPEDTEAGWKAFCKLCFGVPILRAEDEEFRNFYDSAIKQSLTYEQKLKAMSYMPVTSLMTVKQLSAYADAMQAYFRQAGVILESQ